MEGMAENRAGGNKVPTGRFFFWFFALAGTILFCAELATLFAVGGREGLQETTAFSGEEGVVLRSGDLESDQLALTCNVDWGEDVLPQMLEVFREKQVKVTFFVTGQWAQKHPDLVRQMYLLGHDVQSHGYHHVLFGQIGEAEACRELERSEDVFYEILGYRPAIFAPPSGDYSEATVKLCREKGYVLSLWSSDTIDWKSGSTAEVIRERILNKPLSGAIVLMHPKEETVKALPDLIDEIRNRGVEIVPVSDFVCRMDKMAL